MLSLNFWSMVTRSLSLSSGTPMGRLWTPLVRTVLWWRMVLVMLLFSDSLPAGLTPNLGFRHPGLLFGCWNKLLRNNHLDEIVNQLELVYIEVFIFISKLRIINLILHLMMVRWEGSSERTAWWSLHLLPRTIFIVRILLLMQLSQSVSLLYKWFASLIIQRLPSENILTRWNSRL